MSHRGESMEEDDMVMRVGNSLRQGGERRTDGGGRAASPRDHIRRCQGLAEGWPWQPPKDPLQISASSSQISATSVYQSVGRIQNPTRGTAQPKGQKVLSPELIPKIIIFLHAKNHIYGYINTIHSWLITKGYTIKQAKIAI